jgi:hypothetical protein
VMGTQPGQTVAPPDASAQPSRKDQIRFLGALGLFLVWVAVLVAMAALSASRPAARPAKGQVQGSAGTGDAPGQHGQ